MTRCLAPDCQMGGLGCDNMTVILICHLNGQSYEKLAERCSTLYTARSRSYSTGSSESNSDDSTSCSTTPEPLSDEDNSPKFHQKKASANDLMNNKKLSTSNPVPSNVMNDLTEIKNTTTDSTDESKFKNQD